MITRGHGFRTSDKDSLPTPVSITPTPPPLSPTSARNRPELNIRVAWIDRRVLCEEWEGVFSRLHATHRKHDVGPMPGLEGLMGMGACD